MSIADGGGTSGERSYDFWVIKNNNAAAVGDFAAPPDRGQVEKIMIGLAETERIK